MNEYDLLASLAQGEVSREDLLEQNFTLQSKEEYKGLPKVQKMFSDEEGNFDEKAFNETYQKGVSLLNSEKRKQYRVAKHIQEENNIPTFIDSEYNKFMGYQTFEPTPDISVQKTDPLRRDVGLTNIGEMGPREYSISEIAQMNKVRDAETGELLDLTAEDYMQDRMKSLIGLSKKSDHSTLVLEQESDGQFRYRTLLEDESVSGKQVLNFQDTFTSEGSFMNKYNFLENDDLKKSWQGALASNAFDLGVSLIPYVGPAYIYYNIGKTVLQGGAELYKSAGEILSDDPRDFAGYSAANEVSKLTRELTGGVSEYSQQNIFTIENGLNLVSSAFGQLKFQRSIATLPAFANNVKYGLRSALKNYDKVIRTGKNVFQSQSMTANKIGSYMGSGAMAMMSSAGISDIIAKEKIDSKDGAIMHALAASALFGLYRTDIGRLAERGITGNSIGNMISRATRKSIDKHAGQYLKAATKNQKANILKNISNDYVANIGSQLKGFMQKARDMGVANTVTGGMVSEGIEEGTEVLIENGIQKTYNTLIDVGAIEAEKKFKIKDVGKQLAASLVFGSISGGIFKLADGNFGDVTDFSVPELVALGHKDDVIKSFEKQLKIIPNDISFDTDDNGEFLPANKTNKSQRELVMDGIRDTVDGMEQAFNYLGVSQLQELGGKSRKKVLTSLQKKLNGVDPANFGNYKAEQLLNFDDKQLVQDLSEYDIFKDYSSESKGLLKDMEQVSDEDLKIAKAIAAKSLVNRGEVTETEKEFLETSIGKNAVRVVREEVGAEKADRMFQLSKVLSNNKQIVNTLNKTEKKALRLSNARFATTTGLDDSFFADVIGKASDYYQKMEEIAAVRPVNQDAADIDPDTVKESQAEVDKLVKEKDELKNEIDEILSGEKDEYYYRESLFTVNKAFHQFFGIKSLEDFYAKHAVNKDLTREEVLEAATKDYQAHLAKGSTGNTIRDAFQQYMKMNDESGHDMVTLGQIMSEITNLNDFVERDDEGFTTFNFDKIEKGSISDEQFEDLNNKNRESQKIGEGYVLNLKERTTNLSKRIPAFKPIEEKIDAIINGETPKEEINQEINQIEEDISNLISSLEEGDTAVAAYFKDVDPKLTQKLEQNFTLEKEQGIEGISPTTTKLLSKETGDVVQTFEEDIESYEEVGRQLYRNYGNNNKGLQNLAKSYMNTAEEFEALVNFDEELSSKFKKNMKFLFMSAFNKKQLDALKGKSAPSVSTYLERLADNDFEATPIMLAIAKDAFNNNKQEILDNIATNEILKELGIENIEDLQNALVRETDVIFEYLKSKNLVPEGIDQVSVQSQMMITSMSGLSENLFLPLLLPTSKLQELIDKHSTQTDVKFLPVKQTKSKAFGQPMAQLQDYIESYYLDPDNFGASEDVLQDLLELENRISAYKGLAINLFGMHGVVNELKDVFNRTEDLPELNNTEFGNVSVEINNALNKLNNLIEIASKNSKDQMFKIKRMRHTHFINFGNKLNKALRGEEFDGKLEVAADKELVDAMENYQQAMGKAANANNRGAEDPEIRKEVIDAFTGLSKEVARVLKGKENVLRSLYYNYEHGVNTSITENESILPNHAFIAELIAMMQGDYAQIYGFIKDSIKEDPNSPAPMYQQEFTLRQVLSFLSDDSPFLRHNGLQKYKNPSDEPGKPYSTVLTNSMIIEGIGGIGKSLFIIPSVAKYMSQGGATFRIFAPHNEQVNNIQSELDRKGISQGLDGGNLKALHEYLDKVLGAGTMTAIRKEGKERGHAKLEDVIKKIADGNLGIDAHLIVDEATNITQAEAIVIDVLAANSNSKAIFLGDPMQKQVENTMYNNLSAIKTPLMDIPIRSGLYQLNQPMDVLRGRYKDAISMSMEGGTIQTDTKISNTDLFKKIEVYNTKEGDANRGIFIGNPSSEYIDTALNNEESVIVISDNPEKWQNSKVTVYNYYKDDKPVQGQQADHVVIDVESIPDLTTKNLGTFNNFRKAFTTYNTLLSRAKKSVLLTQPTFLIQESKPDERGVVYENTLTSEETISELKNQFLEDFGEYNASDPVVSVSSKAYTDSEAPTQQKGFVATPKAPEPSSPLSKRTYPGQMAKIFTENLPDAAKQQLGVNDDGKIDANSALHRRQLILNSDRFEFKLRFKKYDPETDKSIFADRGLDEGATIAELVAVATKNANIKNVRFEKGDEVAIGSNQVGEGALPINPEMIIEGSEISVDKDRLMRGSAGVIVPGNEQRPIDKIINENEHVTFGEPLIVVNGYQDTGKNISLAEGQAIILYTQDPSISESDMLRLFLDGDRRVAHIKLRSVERSLLETLNTINDIPSGAKGADFAKAMDLAVSQSTSVGVVKSFKDFFDGLAIAATKKLNDIKRVVEQNNGLTPKEKRNPSQAIITLYENEVVYNQNLDHKPSFAEWLNTKTGHSYETTHQELYNYFDEALAQGNNDRNGLLHTEIMPRSTAKNAGVHNKLKEAAADVLLDLSKDNNYYELVEDKRNNRSLEYFNFKTLNKLFKNKVSELGLNAEEKQILSELIHSVFVPQLVRPKDNYNIRSQGDKALKNGFVHFYAGTVLQEGSSNSRGQSSFANIATPIQTAGNDYAPGNQLTANVKRIKGAQVAFDLEYLSEELGLKITENTSADKFLKESGFYFNTANGKRRVEDFINGLNTNESGNIFLVEKTGEPSKKDTGSFKVYKATLKKTPSDIEMSSLGDPVLEVSANEWNYLVDKDTNHIYFKHKNIDKYPNRVIHLTNSGYVEVGSKEKKETLAGVAIARNVTPETTEGFTIKDVEAILGLPSITPNHFLQIARNGANGLRQRAAEIYADEISKRRKYSERNLRLLLTERLKLDSNLPEFNIDEIMKTLPAGRFTSGQDVSLMFDSIEAVDDAEIVYRQEPPKVPYAEIRFNDFYTYLEDRLEGFSNVATGLEYAFFRDVISNVEFNLDSRTAINKDFDSALKEYRKEIMKRLKVYDDAIINAIDRGYHVIETEQADDDIVIGVDEYINERLSDEYGSINLEGTNDAMEDLSKVSNPNVAFAIYRLIASDFNNLVKIFKETSKYIIPGKDSNGDLKYYKGDRQTIRRDHNYDDVDLSYVEFIPSPMKMLTKVIDFDRKQRGNNLYNIRYTNIVNLARVMSQEGESYDDYVRFLKKLKEDFENNNIQTYGENGITITQMGQMTAIYDEYFSEDGIFAEDSGLVTGSNTKMFVTFMNMLRNAAPVASITLQYRNGKLTRKYTDSRLDTGTFSAMKEGLLKKGYKPINNTGNNKREHIINVASRFNIRFTETEINQLLNNPKLDVLAEAVTQFNNILEETDPAEKLPAEITEVMSIFASFADAKNENEPRLTRKNIAGNITESITVRSKIDRPDQALKQARKSDSILHKNIILDNFVEFSVLDGISTEDNAFAHNAIDAKNNTHINLMAGFLQSSGDGFISLSFATFADKSKNYFISLNAKSGRVRRMLNSGKSARDTYKSEMQNIYQRKADEIIEDYNDVFGDVSTIEDVEKILKKTTKAELLKAASNAGVDFVERIHYNETKDGLGIKSQLKQRFQEGVLVSGDPNTDLDTRLEKDFQQFVKTLDEYGIVSTSGDQVKILGGSEHVDSFKKNYGAKSDEEILRIYHYTWKLVSESVNTAFVGVIEQSKGEDAAKMMVDEVKRNVIYSSSFQGFYPHNMGIEEKTKVAYIEDPSTKLKTSVLNQNLTGDSQEVMDGSSFQTMLEQLKQETSLGESIRPGRYTKPFGSSQSSSNITLVKLGMMALTNQAVLQSRGSELDIGKLYREKLYNFDLIKTDSDLTDVQRDELMGYINEVVGDHKFYKYNDGNVEEVTMSDFIYNHLSHKTTYKDVWEFFGAELSVSETNQKTRIVGDDDTNYWISEDSHLALYYLETQIEKIFKGSKGNSIGRVYLKSATKKGAINVNPESRFRDNKPLNTTLFDNTYYGIQLSKEHDVDEFKSSIATQIVNALSLGRNTPGYAQELYDLLSKMIMLSEEEFLSPEQNNKRNNHKPLFDERANKIKLKNVIMKSLSEGELADNLSKLIQEFYEQNEDISVDHRKIRNGVASRLASTLSKFGIRAKQSGGAYIVAPTHDIFMVYDTDDGRTLTSEDLLFEPEVEHSGPRNLRAGNVIFKTVDGATYTLHDLQETQIVYEAERDLRENYNEKNKRRKKEALTVQYKKLVELTNPENEEATATVIVENEDGDVRPIEVTIVPEQSESRASEIGLPTRDAKLMGITKGLAIENHDNDYYFAEQENDFSEFMKLAKHLAKKKKKTVKKIFNNTKPTKENYKELLAAIDVEDREKFASARVESLQNYLRSTIARIPGQGPQSFMGVKVAFFHDSMENIVLAPPEIMLYQGADMDIDVETMAGFMADEDGIIRGVKKKDIYDRDENLKTNITQTNLMNRVSQILYEFIMDPKNKQDADSEISMMQHEKGTNRTIEGKINPYNATVEGITKELNNTGKRVIGIVATELKVFEATLIHYSNVENLDTIYDYELLDEKGSAKHYVGFPAGTNLDKIKNLSIQDRNELLERLSKFNDKFNTTMDLEQALEEYFGDLEISNPVWLAMSSLLSAATDNAKELKLPLYNIDVNTAPLATFMTKIGVPESMIDQLMNSPELVMAQKKVSPLIMSGDRPTSLKNALAQVLKDGKGNTRTTKLLMRILAATEYHYHLGRQLSINQGVANSITKLINFKRSFEEFIRNHGELNSSLKNLKDFDYMRFIKSYHTGDNYYQDMINLMNDAIQMMEDSARDEEDDPRLGDRHLNPLAILASNEHYMGYLKSQYDSYIFMTSESKVTRLTESLYDEMIENDMKPNEVKLSAASSFIDDYVALRYLEGRTARVSGNRRSYRLDYARERQKFIEEMNGYFMNKISSAGTKREDQFWTRLQIDSREDRYTGNTIMFYRPITNMVSNEFSTNREISAMQSGFKELSEKDQKLIFYYNLILNRNAETRQSFTKIFTDNISYNFIRFFEDTIQDLQTDKVIKFYLNHMMLYYSAVEEDSDQYGIQTRFQENKISRKLKLKKKDVTPNTRSDIIPWDLGANVERVSDQNRVNPIKFDITQTENDAAVKTARRVSNVGKVLLIGSADDSNKRKIAYRLKQSLDQKEKLPHAFAMGQGPIAAIVIDEIEGDTNTKKSKNIAAELNEFIDDVDTVVLPIYEALQRVPEGRTGKKRKGKKPQYRKYTSLETRQVAEFLTNQKGFVEVKGIGGKGTMIFTRNTEGTPDNLIPKADVNVVDISADVTAPSGKPASEVDSYNKEYRYFRSENMTYNKSYGFALSDSEDAVFFNVGEETHTHITDSRTGEILQTLDHNKKNDIKKVHTELKADRSNYPLLNHLNLEGTFETTAQVPKQLAPSIMTNAAIIDALLGKLQAMNPEIRVQRVNTKWLRENMDGRMGKTFSDAKGFVFGNTVYINSDTAGFDTPIHEFAHIWLEMIRVQNPEQYNNIIQEYQNHPLKDEIRSSYKELSEEELTREAFVTLVGYYSAQTSNTDVSSLRSVLTTLFGANIGMNDIFGDIIQRFGDEVMNKRLPDNGYKHLARYGINIFNKTESQLEILQKLINNRKCE